jgi:hypothetical protein
MRSPVGLTHDEWSNLGIGGMDGSSHLEKLKHLRSYHSTWMLVGVKQTQEPCGWLTSQLTS